jgi:hypothetical protein
MNSEMKTKLMMAFQGVEPAQIGYRTAEKLADAAFKVLSEPTTAMVMAGSLAHNADPRPLDLCISGGDAEIIFKAMVRVAHGESLNDCVIKRSSTDK